VFLKETSEVGVQLPSASEGYACISSISKEMQAVQRLISEIAPTDIPVLLVGESGTGKEIAGVQIHRLSQYKELPFVRLSCAGLAADGLDARGSGQGRVRRNGNNAGTLFLDEIAELDANSQRQLLSGIANRDRLGSDPLLAGRLVSCTTRDMELEIKSGRFRSELFYRLNGVCVQLPPLRNRREDIPLLVQHFLNKYSQTFQRSQMAISDRALQLFLEYTWPGNIRELENVIKRVVALDSEELGLADLRISPPAGSVSGTSDFSRPSLKAASRAASRQAERELILRALEKTRWNRKRAAEALQISYKSLLFKLKQIQMPEPDEGQKDWRTT
jgi:two-component system, NtrC family, response regulator AtoC